MIGELLSHYRIVEKLGEGGMGVVYKAEDTKLRRTVALKFLPDGLAQDRRTLDRFLREARAASALNHPNICTIYEIDESAGRQFIAMEALDGQTLRQRILGKPLGVDEIIDIGLQVVAGLEAAHEKGIVHRDIKPANIFITDRGAVKILDFGLAKLAGDPVAADEMTATGTVAGPLTHPGTAIGTVAYMSPEQATGLTLDARSDLFSFGAVLYEMATGKPAFSGTTSAVIFDAILHKTPASPVDVNHNLPAAFETLLNKALEKDPKYRYQSAADLRVDLERLRRDSDSQGRTSAGGRVTTPRDRHVTTGRDRWAWLGVGAVAVAAAGSFALWFSGRSSTAASPRLINAVKVTSGLRMEQYATWSPDDSALAYQSNQTGNWDIWVTQVGGGEPINRTGDSAADDTVPAWSPDGRWIAFFSARDPDGGYFVMPAIGGSPHKVVSWQPDDAVVPAIRATWSPDSTRLAYPLSAAQRLELHIVSLNTGALRTLTLERLPRNNVIGSIQWSPDGRWIAYRRAYSLVAANSELWLTDVSNGRSVRLTDDSKRVWSPNWSADSRELFFVSDRGGPPDLWSLTLGANGEPAGEAQQVTVGIEMSDATFSPDGKKVAYTKSRTISNVFRVPLLRDRRALWTDATQLTFDEAWFESLDISPDGRLVMSSDRGGNWDLWTMPAAGGSLQQLTRDPGIDAGPRWSRDGKDVVFYSTRSGHREIWVQPGAGGPPRQVTNSAVEKLYPSWSPDGREIVIQGEGASAILSAGSGASRKLTDVRFGTPEWSPDGKYVLFSHLLNGHSYVSRAPAAGGAVERLSKEDAGFARWSPDGAQVYFIAEGPRLNSIFRLDVATREERAVANLKGKPGGLGSIALATDGKYLYFTWDDTVGDIWAADIVRK